MGVSFCTHTASDKIVSPNPLIGAIGTNLFVLKDENVAPETDSILSKFIDVRSVINVLLRCPSI